jgi:hypothetical protein
MRIAIILGLIALACGVGCTRGTSPSNGDYPPSGRPEPLATLERTRCFGTCPVYKVTIFRDGTVEYVGRQYVKVRGRATGHLSAEQLVQLRTLFQQSGYLQLGDSYERVDVTDQPSAYTSYSPAPGRTKTVRHYLGDRSAPRALTDVEEGIDRIVNIEQWIGTPEERQGLPRT